MTLGAATRAQFERLLAQGWLPRSTCSAALLKALRPLLESAVVVEERAGAGRRLAVRDAGAARDFVRQHYPDAAVGAGATSRVVGVARFRDTKALAADEPEIVCLRAWREDALLCDGQRVEAAAATERHGLFSFLLRSDSRYTLCGPCALVENPAVFTALERLELGVGLALYGRGRASHRLIEWLADVTAPDFRVLHLPDYDPVGLAEFERLAARLGSRVALHMPDDLAARFARFANRTLLEKAATQALLSQLRRSALPSVREVLALIDRHNAGLEQEALLLGRPNS